MRIGQVFENEDVARCYLHRPPYPDELFDRLIDISPAQGAALDLGCGTGKIAQGLSPSFDRICAVDPSEAMLSIAKSLERDSPSNITWLNERAESADFEGQPFDLVVAGSSIHWMDQATVFPRLFEAVNTKHTFAVVDGDAAFQLSWKDEYNDFAGSWLDRLIQMGRSEQRAQFGSYQEFKNRHRRFLDVSGETGIISQPVFQTVEDFILCLHSRDAFAKFRLGSLSEEFDRELASILRPYVTDGLITFRVQTKLTWGSIRTGPKA